MAEVQSDRATTRKRKGVLNLCRTSVPRILGDSRS